MMIDVNGSCMPRESVVFGAAVIGVIIGLSIVLFGEALGGRMDFLSIGGVVVLLSVGWIALNVSRLESP